MPGADQRWTGLLALRQPAVVFTHFLVINAVVGQVQRAAKHCVSGPTMVRSPICAAATVGLELVAAGREMSTQHQLARPCSRSSDSWAVDATSMPSRV